jgi:hypothetical protein
MQSVGGFVFPDQPGYLIANTVYGFTGLTHWLAPGIQSGMAKAGLSGGEGIATPVTVLTRVQTQGAGYPVMVGVGTAGNTGVVETGGRNPSRRYGGQTKTGMGYRTGRVRRQGKMAAKQTRHSDQAVEKG